jgi:hypothetical protein
MSVSRDVTEIALALVGLSLAGLLISRSGDTATVVKSVSSGYGNLLAVATAQNSSMGAGFHQ